MRLSKESAAAWLEYWRDWLPRSSVTRQGLRMRVGRMKNENDEVNDELPMFALI